MRQETSREISADNPEAPTVRSSCWSATNVTEADRLCRKCWTASNDRLPLTLSDPRYMTEMFQVGYSVEGAIVYKYQNGALNNYCGEHYEKQYLVYYITDVNNHDIVYHITMMVVYSCRYFI